MELADAITVSNNFHKKAKLHFGVLKTKAMFVTCVFENEEMGTLKSFDLTTPM